MATEQATARTPLHAWHTAHGARMGERAGWHVPLSYGGADAKVAAARAGVAVADVSSFPKWSLAGPAVLAFAEASFPGSAALRPRGVAPIGGGAGLACRLADDALLLIGLGVGSDALGPELTRADAFPNLVRQDVTSAYAAFWLWGPDVVAVLAGLTALDVSPAALPPGACAETGVAAVHATLVRPPGLPVPSLLLCVGWDVGAYVWERLLDTGRVTPLGIDGLGELLASVEREPSGG